MANLSLNSMQEPPCLFDDSVIQVKGTWLKLMEIVISGMRQLEG
jgi:hypothetical protein